MGEVKQENSPKSKSHLSQRDGLQEPELLAQQGIPSTFGNQIISRIGNAPSLKVHADMLNRAPATNKQLLLQLQRQYGNSYVQQVVQQARQQDRPKIQAKLTIGEPGDKYEQEADRVAQQVVRQINAPVLVPSGQSEAVQRQMPEEKEEELAQMKAEADSLQRQMPEEKDEDELQMKPMVQRQADARIDAAPDVEASINQARGGGQPLAENIREPMEQAFGADFSGVKVHTDTQSDQLNQSIQARAFTTGQDVFFGQGEYNPSSQGGQELIAHELTHVVQQNGGAVLRSPLPPQQLAPHPATETPSASARDLPLQAKGDKTGNRRDSSVEQRPNKTGMPDALKVGVESLSGYSLDDVRVHYNSPKPAQLQALAYTQGTEIHVASGQEEHLPHEAWHIVQQAQGRVQPTMEMKDGVPVNDDAGLEREADVMGGRADADLEQQSRQKGRPDYSPRHAGVSVIQCQPKNINQSHTLKLNKDGNIENVEAERVDPPVSYPMNTVINLKIIDHDEVLGGHLFKREYGGSDNYSNVVTWSERSEKAFTEFENEYIAQAGQDARVKNKTVTYNVKTEANFGKAHVTQKDLFRGMGLPTGKAELDARHSIWLLTKQSLETVPTSVKVSLNGLPEATSFSREGSKMLKSKVTPSAANAKTHVNNIVNGVADARIKRALDRLNSP